MKDVAKHVNGVIKEAATVACRKAGIDPGEVGWWVGGFGEILPLVNNETGDIMAFQPQWVIGLTLRHTLLGYPPLAANAPLIGILPADDRFRKTVEQFLPQLVAKRDEEFNRAGNEIHQSGLTA